MKTYEQISNIPVIQDRIAKIQANKIITGSEKEKRLLTVTNQCRMLANLSAAYEYVFEHMRKDTGKDTQKHWCFIEALLDKEDIRLQKLLGLFIYPS